MPRFLTMLTAAGACAAIAATSQAQAEEFNRSQEARVQRAYGDDAVAVRLRLPLAGEAARDWRRGASLSLRLSQTGAGETRSFDLVSYSFADEGAVIESPFGRYGYDGDHRRGGWSQRRLLVAAGLTLAAGVIIANMIDENEETVQFDDT